MFVASLLLKVLSVQKAFFAAYQDAKEVAYLYISSHDSYHGTCTAKINVYIVDFD